ncbi:MAG: NAD(P)/FAD-dependent oxidoreductase [Defluviicoccus sp.]|nr:NAD(P)/FAD-dependent oxidoreductase [Defluviicoccus sp.]MDE0277520.1 NAD(P)/FAD-dependent oxidoreductase [Defluviicoccus sp.]
MTVLRHAEIAGAGFAGLVAAVALADRGWTVRVHERAEALRAFGAGIFIWENGLRVLRAIGAYDDVVAGSHDGEVYEVRDRDRVVAETPFHIGMGSRMLTMTRQTLYAAILRQAERRDVEIRTRSEVVGAEPEGVLLTADGGRHAADLVVGADGIHSRVRDSLDLRKERNTGTLGLVRVLAPRCLDELGPGRWDRVIDFWNLPHRSLRILYVPCNAEDLYLAMMAPVEDEEATAVPVRTDIWVPAFPQLEPAIRRVSAEGRYDAYETGKLTRWSSGRVAIVGDSAHAMVPSLGQGAGLAMVNALGLAVALDEATDVPVALSGWEERERPLTEYTQDMSAKVARDRLDTAGRIWSDGTVRTALSVPTGTEHLPHFLDGPNGSART